jgi:hypothetical protein
VLEIVERILAALIILALLTLLIFLAYPVPARLTVPPTLSTPREEQRTTVRVEPPKRDTVPQPSPPRGNVDGAGAGATIEAQRRAEEAQRRAEEAEKRAQEAARRAELEANRRADNSDLAPIRPSRPAPPTGRRDCLEPPCRHPLRAGGRSCSTSDCGCGDARARGRRNNRPFWASPPRRYAVHDDDPDWYDERVGDPGPPPGTCPD